MKEMDMTGFKVVAINYKWRSLPPAAQLFKPVVYKDGDHFCCLTGSDPQAGIFGSGRTATEAINDWDTRLHQTIESGEIQDEMVQYFMEKLKSI